jgi:hypothetical protein
MKKILRELSKIPARPLLYLFVAVSLVCVVALRQNNQQMVKLRDAVYAADKNNGDVTTAVNNLRGYVYGHMNTDLSSGNNNIKPPIQLQYTYQRLYNAQLNQVQSANQQIYTDAQFYCHSSAPANSVQAQLTCIQNYAVNHGVSNANINIPAGLYEFDFASPAWSPDLAGWSLLLSFILFIAFLVRLGVNRIRIQK